MFWSVFDDNNWSEGDEKFAIMYGLKFSGISMLFSIADVCI